MSKSIELEIKDIRGLHAQKCLSICKAAQAFESSIVMNHNGHIVDIKSILGLLSLACPQGSIVTIEAFGNDSEAAINMLKELVC